MTGLEIREIIITRDLALDDGLELESDFWSNLTATEDMKEGAQAFVEKRKPNYQCREGKHELTRLKEVTG